MSNLLEANCDCLFHQEIYTHLHQIKQKIAIIGSLDNLSETKFNQRAKILNIFLKVQTVTAFFQTSCTETSSELNKQFYQGYQIGKQCNLVLYDASQIPIQHLKKALTLNPHENFIPPYLLGIQVGWRLAVIEQTLTHFFPDQQTYYL